MPLPARPLLLALAAALLALPACSGDEGGDGAPRRLYRRVVEQRSIDVGGGGASQLVRIGQPPDVVELEIPGDVVPTRARIQVSVVEGVPRRGRTPVNDRGVLVEPAGLTFAQPVRVRQRVPAPPPMRGYVAVVLEQGAEETGFVARGPARRLMEATAQDMRELWEGDGTGAGLWGLAVD
jgi:hypothetical protein